MCENPIESCEMDATSGNVNAQAVSAGQTVKRDWLAWFLVAVLLLCTVDMILASDVPIRIAGFFFLGAVLYYRDWTLVPCALLLFYMFVVAHYYPDWVWRIPTAAFFVPLALCWISCLPFEILRKGFAWFRKGQLSQVEWLLVLLTSLVSAVALILWALWTDYLGVATQMLAPLKQAPRWFAIPILVPGFALVNAFAEEAVYRGLIQDALEKTFGERPWLVLGVQASAFAAVHFQAGFPNGKIGYLMTFIYALMLGWLKRRTGGLLAPYLAHVAADTVIGITLVLLATV